MQLSLYEYATLCSKSKILLTARSDWLHILKKSQLTLKDKCSKVLKHQHQTRTHTKLHRITLMLLRLKFNSFSTDAKKKLRKKVYFCLSLFPNLFFFLKKHPNSVRPKSNQAEKVSFLLSASHSHFYFQLNQTVSQRFSNRCLKRARSNMVSQK